MRALRRGGCEVLGALYLVTALAKCNDGWVDPYASCATLYTVAGAAEFRPGLAWPREALALLPYGALAGEFGLALAFYLRARGSLTRYRKRLLALGALFHVGLAAPREEHARRAHAFAYATARRPKQRPVLEPAKKVAARTSRVQLTLPADEPALGGTTTLVFVEARPEVPTSFVELLAQVHRAVLDALEEVDEDPLLDGDAFRAHVRANRERLSRTWSVVS